MRNSRDVCLEKSSAKSPCSNRLYSALFVTLGFTCCSFAAAAAAAAKTGGTFFTVEVKFFFSSFRWTIGFNFTGVLPFVVIRCQRLTASQQMANIPTHYHWIAHYLTTTSILINTQLFTIQKKPFVIFHWTHPVRIRSSKQPSNNVSVEDDGSVTFYSA